MWSCFRMKIAIICFPLACMIKSCSFLGCTFFFAQCVHKTLLSIPTLMHRNILVRVSCLLAAKQSSAWKREWEQEYILAASLFVHQISFNLLSLTFMQNIQRIYRFDATTQWNGCRFTSMEIAVAFLANSEMGTREKQNDVILENLQVNVISRGAFIQRMYDKLAMRNF